MGGDDTRDECSDKARLDNLYLGICTGKHFLSSHMQVLLEAYSASVTVLAAGTHQS